LQLSHEISRLGEKISNLQSQDVMLDTLIRKAELTGDAQELRLLQKSKSALGRELRQLAFQRTQYEQQESANRLVPGRTKVAIVNSTVGEEEGKSVVRYLIEVQQLAMDGSFASGWVVARRYNEFFLMHQRLRERYLMVKNLDFPGKRLVTHLSNNFVDARRVALEKYLQVSHSSYSSPFDRIIHASFYSESAFYSDGL
jgi:sorting nexin-25